LETETAAISLCTFATERQTILSAELFVGAKTFFGVSVGVDGGVLTSRRDVVFACCSGCKATQRLVAVEATDEERLLTFLNAEGSVVIELEVGRLLRVAAPEVYVWVSSILQSATGILLDSVKRSNDVV